MGFNHVAGVDEVGRGCLAGPVVAAAVVLDPDRYVPRVCDSKTVTALERERLYDQITRAAVAWGVAAADPEEIDPINIHQASLRAMQRAVLTLCPVAGLRAGRRLPHPGPADGAAGGRARRRALHGDRGGVDRRESDARPHDARAARARSPLRLRPPQGLRDARITSTRSPGSAIRTSTGARSGRRPCLIGWSHSWQLVPARPHTRALPGSWRNPGAHRPRRHAEKSGEAAPPGAARCRHRRVRSAWSKTSRATGRPRTPSAICTCAPARPTRLRRSTPASPTTS